MTRRAFNSPMNWKQNLLLAMAMGSAAVLLGCGGGGGGTGGPGPQPGDCGSPAGSGTVVCGFVTAFGTNTGVNGATVRLRNSSGQTVASGTTATDVSSGSAGFFKIAVAGSTVPTLVSVDVPSTGYFTNYLQYKSLNYDAGQNARAGGPCVPAITAVPNADTRLLDKLIIFSDQGPPVPPVFTCPR